MYLAQNGELYRNLWKATIEILVPSSISVRLYGIRQLRLRVYMIAGLTSDPANECFG